MNTAHAIKDTNQIKELLDVYPKDSKNRLLIEYALRTGLRISDILSVRVSDVLGRDTYIINEQKTGKMKELALHDALKLSIFSYASKHKLELDDYLFFSNVNKKAPIQRMQAHRIIAKAGDMIGVILSAHSLRKTFGYQAYKQGVDITLLQSIFQHSSQAVTLRYIDITQENINDVYKKINLGF